MINNNCYRLFDDIDEDVLHPSIYVYIVDLMSRSIGIVKKTK